MQSRNHICSSDFFEYLLIWRMGPDNDQTWRQTFSNCKREDQWYASVKRYPFLTNSDKGIHSCRSWIFKLYDHYMGTFLAFIYYSTAKEKILISWKVPIHFLPLNSDKDIHSSRSLIPNHMNLIWTFSFFPAIQVFLAVFFYSTAETIKGGNDMNFL